MSRERYMYYCGMMLPLRLPLPLPLCLSSASQDINPSSMFIDHAGNVKLCDFGISGQLLDCEVVPRDGGTAKYVAVSLWNHVVCK